MDRTSAYYKQVQLLVQVLPLVAEEDCFALKGVDDLPVVKWKLINLKNMSDKKHKVAYANLQQTLGVVGK